MKSKVARTIKARIIETTKTRGTTIITIDAERTTTKAIKETRALLGKRQQERQPVDNMGRVARRARTRNLFRCTMCRSSRRKGSSKQLAIKEHQQASNRLSHSTRSSKRAAVVKVAIQRTHLQVARSKEIITRRERKMLKVKTCSTRRSRINQGRTSKHSKLQIQHRRPLQATRNLRLRILLRQQNRHNQLHR